MKTEEICGIEKEINYDDKIERLNFELKKVYLKDDKEGFYAIDVENWKINGGCKLLFRMHIQEAIELKSIVDSLVFDALSHKGDKEE